MYCMVKACTVTTHTCSTYGKPNLGLTVTNRRSSPVEYRRTSIERVASDAATSASSKPQLCRIREEFGCIWMPAPISETAFLLSNTLTECPERTKAMAHDNPQIPAPLMIMLRGHFAFAIVAYTERGVRQGLETFE